MLRLGVGSGRGVGVSLAAALAWTATAACGSENVPQGPMNQSEDPSTGGGGSGDSGVDASTNQPGGGGTNIPGGSGSNEPFCKVAAIVEAKCQTCHAAEPLYGAPMSLTAHEDFLAQGPVTSDKLVYELIGERIHDAQRPMPPPGSAALTEDEKAVLDAWIAAGAPAATGSCDASDPGGDPDDDDPYVINWPPPDCEESFQIVSHAEGDTNAPMIVKAGTETHPQVIWDAPWGDEEVQAVGFRPIADNKKVLHHWILYENGAGNGSNGLPIGAFITGWAPGNDGDERQLPPDVGMYLPKGAQSLRLDMHYYNLGGSSDEEDRSGVEICIARKPRTREYTGTVFMGFSKIVGLSIPPGESDQIAYCKVAGSQPVTVMSVSPHAHELAVNMKLEVKRVDGTIEVWHDEPFAFEDQRIFPLDKQLHPGDLVKTTCSYVNPGSQNVGFGESTNDEMCFNFVAYYPMGGFQCDLLGSLFERF